MKKGDKVRLTDKGVSYVRTRTYEWDFAKLDPKGPFEVERTYDVYVYVRLWDIPWRTLDYPVDTQLWCFAQDELELIEEASE